MMSRIKLLLPTLLLYGLIDVAFARQAVQSQPPAELPVAQRIAGRDFPSVFMAWNPADNLQGEDPLTTAARHDLLFHAPGYFGLQWNNASEGLATGFTPESVRAALARRQALLEKNPHLVLLAEIRYRDAYRSFLPENHRWWKRDSAGKLEMGWAEGGYIKLNFADPEYQRQVAAQASAAVATGAVDGVMLDWWEDDAAHLALIRQVRAAIGGSALILVNANDRQIPQTAPYINGLFMECYRSKTIEDWNRIADTLRFAEAHLRRPHIDCLETWYHSSRNDLNLMRATTCMSLTLSDGYCLFSDPNDLPTPDHLHNWYPFWAKSLGRPLKTGRRYPDGTIRREFERGTVIYNPPGNRDVTVTFAEPRRSAASGATAATQPIAALDGDIFLKPMRLGSTKWKHRRATPISSPIRQQKVGRLRQGLPACAVVPGVPAPA